jgi:transcriptional/translational regulatory protein YebC/TACO1
MMTKNNGNLGESGCVSWMFEQKGYILVEKTKVDEDPLMSAALDAGAEDMKNDPNEDNYEIITAPENLAKVKASIEASGVPVSLAEITMLAKNYVTVDERQAEQMMRLTEALEDHDDVQNVYTNVDIPDEVIAKIGK